MDAGLVNAETVHVDATPIRADVSWASIAADHAEKVLTKNADDEAPPMEIIIATSRLHDARGYSRASAIAA